MNHFPEINDSIWEWQQECSQVLIIGFDSKQQKIIREVFEYIKKEYLLQRKYKQKFSNKIRFK
jgi:hypothetical protein